MGETGARRGKGAGPGRRRGVGAEIGTEEAGARTGEKKEADPGEEETERGVREEVTEEETEAGTGGWRQDLGLHQEEVQEDQSPPSEEWEMSTANFISVTSDPPPPTCPSPQRREMPGPSSACSSARGAGPGTWRTSSLVWGRSGMSS